MNITYDKKLTDYMTKKGYTAITVDTVSAVGCCADTCELALGFGKPAHAEELARKAARTLEGELGQIFVMARGLEYDEEIRFGLRNFLGVKDITVEGIRAFSL